MTGTDREAMSEQTINDHTLPEVVARYLAELDNPAPDCRMRQVYREWMAEFVADVKVRR